MVACTSLRGPSTGFPLGIFFWPYGYIFSCSGLHTHLPTHFLFSLAGFFCPPPGIFFAYNFRAVDILIYTNEMSSCLRLSLYTFLCLFPLPVRRPGVSSYFVLISPIFERWWFHADISSHSIQSICLVYLKPFFEVVRSMASSRYPH